MNAELDSYVRFADMPTSIHALICQNSDGTYTIVINSRIGSAAQLEAYLHELEHINNNDFEKTDVQSIEMKAHENKGGVT